MKRILSFIVFLCLFSVLYIDIISLPILSAAEIGLKKASAEKDSVGFSFTNVSIKVFPQTAQLFDNKYIIVDPVNIEGAVHTYTVSENEGPFFLRSAGYMDKYLFNLFNVDDPDEKGPVINIPAENSTGIIGSAVNNSGIEVDKNNKHIYLEVKLEKIPGLLDPIIKVSTGDKPKSAAFSPDGSVLAVVNLAGRGCDLFSVPDLTWFATLEPDQAYAVKQGFVEPLFLESKNEFWMSQMTTDTVHIFCTITWRHLESIGSGGAWPKVLTATHDEELVFVSNWSGRSITVFDAFTRTIKKRIKVSGVPRGMAVSPDNKYLYIALFDTGKIEKVSLQNLEIENTFSIGAGAARHLLMPPRGNILYITDMYYGRLIAFDTNENEVLYSRHIGSNVNSMDISPCGNFLYISARGRNNPQSYMIKGPEFGHIAVFDIQKRAVVFQIWGGNQPTGLAVSPDGTKLGFTNFLDHTLELFHIKLSQP